MGLAAHRDHPPGEAVPCPMVRMSPPSPGPRAVPEMNLTQMGQILEEVQQLSRPQVSQGSQ